MDACAKITVLNWLMSVHSTAGQHDKKGKKGEEYFTTHIHGLKILYLVDMA
jgi:hypothetical protein